MSSGTEQQEEEKKAKYGYVFPGHPPCPRPHFTYDVL